MYGYRVTADLLALAINEGGKCDKEEEKKQQHEVILQYKYTQWVNIVTCLL
jgi:hypothetical protein